MGRFLSSVCVSFAGRLIAVRLGVEVAAIRPISPAFPAARRFVVRFLVPDGIVLSVVILIAGFIGVTPEIANFGSVVGFQLDPRVVLPLLLVPADDFVLKGDFRKL